MRALRNAGDKRAKRKSVAAIAARIERGYLKRTAGSTACVNNHGDSRGTRSDGNGHPAAERTSTTARDGDDDTRTRKGETRTASAEHGEHAKTARAGRRSRHTGDRKARTVRRRSDEVCGLVIQTEIVPRSRGSAVSRGVDEDSAIVDTKTQRKPRERGKRTARTQMYYISGDDNCRSRVGQVSQCRRERRVRGLETVRDGMGAQTADEVCGTPDERAGCTDSETTFQESWQHSERTVHDYENQSTKTVDDDIKIGVTMLGMEDMRVKEHLIRNSVRITSLNQMREENTTVHRQPTNANAARSDSEEQRQGQREQRAKAEAKDIKGQRQGQGCEKTNRPRK